MVEWLQSGSKVVCNTSGKFAQILFIASRTSSWVSEKPDISMIRHGRDDEKARDRGIVKGQHGAGRLILVVGRIKDRHCASTLLDIGSIVSRERRSMSSTVDYCECLVYV